jgi:5-methyltetrahydrofolate--homocysteine methyltransferase
LNKRFVEGDLREMYNGDVYYANDAFDGLKYMEFILKHKKKGARPKLEIYVDPRLREKKQVESIPKSEIIKSKISTENTIPIPPFFGSKKINNIQIEKVYEYINEVALFRGSWNVYKDRTKPDEEYDELIKNEIIPVFNELKLKAKREKLLVPEVIYGYFPCQSDGNDLIIYKPRNIDSEKLYDVWENIEFENLNADVLEEWTRFTFPRQSTEKHFCISDFFKSKDSGLFDIVSFQIVTVGKKASEYAQDLYNNDKYQEYLYFHGLSVETTEALAEYWHKVIRKELEINKNDSSDIKKIFQQGYRGSRYSFGYPACPNLEDNKILFDILKPERIGVTLTEEWQMVPEQSTNAIVCHHPEAKYFFIK